MLLRASWKKLAQLQTQEIAPAFSVNEVKGWSRATAMHIALAAVDAIGSMDAYVEYLQKNGKFHTYQTQSANFIELPEGMDEVDMNRGHLSNS